MVKLDLKGSTVIYFALCSEVASLHRIRRLVRAGLVVTLVHIWSSAFGLLGSVLVVTLGAALGSLPHPPCPLCGVSSGLGELPLCIWASWA